VTHNSQAVVHTGYAIVTPDGSDVPQGFAILSFSRHVTVSETAIPATEPGMAFYTYVESRGPLRAAWAISNLSTSPAYVTLELAREDGSPMGLSKSISLAANGYIAQFIDELFPALPESFSGMLRITSTEPVAPASLRLRNNVRGDVLVTDIPVFAGAAPAVRNSDLLFPITIEGGGYSTDFVGVKK
jgi:hypothetical protein